MSVTPDLRNVTIQTSQFDRSAADLSGCPDEVLPEFAFIGRSNVGKSSLLNFLTGRPDLARVSPTPGSTRLLNFFLINNAWRLVDLPGYGFAKVARKDAQKFNRAVLEYLRDRPNLCCVYALVDGSLPPQPIDLEFVEWMADNGVPFVLVFTKTDAAGSGTVQRNVSEFLEAISGWCPKAPEVFTCSAKKLEGRNALLRIVEEALRSAAGPAKSTGSKKLPKLPPPPKRRPDRDAARPW